MDMQTTLRLFPLLIGFGAALGLWRIYRATDPRDSLRGVAGGVLTLLGALFGGRAGYILMHLAFYSTHCDEILRFWLGGFNAYGAVAGAILFAALAALLIRGGMLKTLDLMILLLAPVGTTAWLGLWGEGIAYGQVLSAGTFGGVPAPDETGQLAIRFPLQFLAAATLFIILLVVEKAARNLKPGYSFALSGFFFSLHASIILWFRADPVPLWGGVRSDLLCTLALTLFFALIAGVIRARSTKSVKIEQVQKSVHTSSPSNMEESMIDLTIDTNQVRAILTGFIREELSKTGFSKLVLGLSGGLDSTLACYLAAEALGPENVLGVRMPYRTSSPESLEHAQLVIDALGVQSLTIPITDMVEPLFALFPKMDGRRRGNVMARERMIILFDQSEAFKGLVLGTGNKTEYLLGYTTLYGDSANALNPLGDLYKTQVRQLSRVMGVPEVIITKPPSADLWAGQTDEGELGFTYADVDQVLHLLVDQRLAPEEVVEKGFSRAFVHTVIERVRKSHFKRVLPPIAKIEDRENNYDFLKLTDWGV